LDKEYYLIIKSDIHHDHLLVGVPGLWNL
jgi:hypothetical protein